MNGTIFEATVYDLILWQFADQELSHDQASVEMVEQPVQRGRDLEVEIACPVTLFGIHFEPPKNNTLHIAIECKWTGGKGGLSLENFSSNVTQNLDSHYFAYILVTNTYISCNALYEYHNALFKAGIESYVVDGDRLLDIYKERYDTPPFSIVTSKRTDLNGVIYDHVLNSEHFNQNKDGEWTVTLCNNTNEYQLGTLLFQTDKNWSIENKDNSSQLDFGIKPFGLFAHRFALKREVPEGEESIAMSLQVGKEHIQLESSSDSFKKIVFEAPFFGTRNELALNNLTEELRNICELDQMKKCQLHFLSIIGPAGAGKSRLVDELRKNLKNKSHIFRFVRHYFGNLDKDSVKNTRKSFAKEAIHLPVNPGKDRPNDLIDYFAKLRTRKNLVPVFVLDDLHLADEASCHTLLNLIAATKNDSGTGKSDLVIILVGRSDYSYANAAYMSLLSTLPQMQFKRELEIYQRQKKEFESGEGDHLYEVSEPVLVKGHVELDKLDYIAFRQLTMQMLKEAPPAVLDAIDRLSGRIPQHVIHCVEWLLEMTAARAEYRMSTGVVDSELFSRRIDTLPKSMTELLANRFTFLTFETGEEGRTGEQERGKAAQLILCAAALLGPAPSILVFELAPPAMRHDIRNFLVKRRFLTEQEDGSIRWQHESLFLHFRNWLLGEGEQLKDESHLFPRDFKNWNAWRKDGRNRAVTAACSLMAQSEIMENLGSMDKGLIATQSGDHELALTYWKDILDEVADIDNWSTTNLRSETYPYLRWVFKSHAKTHGWSSMLPKLVRTMTYIGGYYWSLSAGIRSASEGWNALKKVKNKDHNVLDIEKLALRTMLAHFHLDAGNTRLSQGELMDLLVQYETRKDKSKIRDIGFEIYNCLGMLYGYLNHRTLAEHYFSMAEAEVRADDVPNKTLIAKLPGDRSLLYQFFDHSKWVSLCATATHTNQKDGSKRHRQHAELGDLLISLNQLVHVPGENGWDEAVDHLLKDIKAIEENCRSTAYFSVLPRMQLLKAATLYVKATGCLQDISHDKELLEEADHQADIGIGIANERGIGYAPWALLNLRAMIAWRTKNYNSAFGFLQNATEILHKDGMLFLGKADLSTPNQIVLANYIKLIERKKSDLDLRSLLARISGHQYPHLHEDEQRETVKASVYKHHALLAGPGYSVDSASLLLDTGIDPQLALVVWF